MYLLYSNGSFSGENIGFININGYYMCCGEHEHARKMHEGEFSGKNSTGRSQWHIARAAHGEDGYQPEKWSAMITPPGMALIRADRDHYELRRYSAAEYGDSSCAWIGCEMLSRSRRRSPESLTPPAQGTSPAEGMQTASCAEDEVCPECFAGQISRTVASALTIPARRSPFAKR